MRNIFSQSLGIVLLITPTTQLFAADVFAIRTNVNRHDAFIHVTGMTEKEFNRNPKANLAQILHHNPQGQYWVHNVKTGRKWHAGQFKTASIQELRNAICPPSDPTGRTKKHHEAPPGTFSVIAGFTPSNLTLEQQKRCNISHIQADPANKGAVFQVASNFNCLEGAGSMLTDYTYASAQGEIAAISALPGTIVRRYGLKPIDLLSKLELPLFRLSGGKINKHLNFIGTSYRDLQQAAALLDYSQVQVGIQLNTDVTFGFVQAGKRGTIHHHETCPHDQANQEMTPNVIQIYTSAVNLYLNSSWFFTQAAYAHVSTIAQQMIRASYEGTLLAAALHGEQPKLCRKNQTVFLTLMGCGVFKNKLEWVADTLEALIKDIQSLNLDVKLLVFDGSTPGMATFLARMNTLVQQTGGTYEEIHPVQMN